MTTGRVFAAALALLAIATAAAGREFPDVDRTSDTNTRQAYYGDLRLVTQDAIAAYFEGTRVTPDEAYRFARGEPVTVDGQSISRKSAPLDFLAVTNMAENLGLFATLDDPNSAFSRTQIGKALRDPATRANAHNMFYDLMFKGHGREEALLGVDPQVVNEVAESAWRQEIAAANRNYQPGKFTTFIGYHWTAKLGGTLDRVVLFRGDNAPMPFTGIDSIRPEDLWTYMENNRKQGHDVIAIPHNPSDSNGLLFNGLDSEGRLIDRAYSERRAANEPLVEIYAEVQSEAHPRLSPQDPFSNFELGADEKKTVVPQGGYVRNALGRGLQIAQKTGGVDPYKVGFVGGTDFHNGLSDAAENASASTPNAHNPAKPLAGPDLRRALEGSWDGSGGLTGVWAEQNTRESIFDALRRKETFATSGTRLKFRFFAGWDYDNTLFENKDWIKAAYRRGAPMGGDLPAKPNGRSAPTFAAWAAKDAAGANLDRLQIIKLWVKDGSYVEKIYDVAVSDGRAPELSIVWRDPDFDPKTRAAYYLRVLEIPTQRWSTIVAARAGIELPARMPTTLQERGWSSPIWYAPPAR